MTASGDRELSGWIGKARKLVMGHLVGKVAVVAGAPKGIGAGIAKELARHGASVVVNYAKRKAQAESVVDDITQAGGKPQPLPRAWTKRKRSSSYLPRQSEYTAFWISW